MSQAPEHVPYSTLEVDHGDPEASQKEAVLQYPDHSYPQAVPFEQSGAGVGHSYYSPETAKEVVNPRYPGNALLPGPYKEEKYAGSGTALAAAYPNSTGPNSTAGYTVSSYSNGAYPAGAASPIQSTGYDPSPMSILTENDVARNAPAEKEVQPDKPAVTICGLSRKKFFIILGVALVVIALAAGLAGGLTSRTHSGSGSDSSAASSGGSSSSGDSGGSSSNSTSDGNLILSNSKITASNWTDPSGVVHRTVFFQDKYNSIIARRWDAKGNAWKTNNLTELMLATTTPLRPQPGTPLASASMELDPTFETHVWFTDPNNMIRSMASTDALNKPDSWDNDTLDAAQLQTWPGGQLAAMWQRCWVGSCSGTWVVAYQRPEGAIKTANSSTWATATVAVESKDVAANSSLAILPKLRESYLDRLELVYEGLESGNGIMRLTEYNDTWNGSDDRVTELQANIPHPTPSQQFAATRWDSWNQALYIGLLGDGSIKGNHWNGNTMSAISTFNFNSGPSDNFTAIAMSPDAMFYGITSDGDILEYSLDTTDPSTFNYVSTVFP